MKIKKRKGRDYSAYLEARAKLPQPDGKHCILCGADLPKRRRKYCSDKCFNDWYIKFPRYDWSEVRCAVLVRDKHACVKCGKKEIDNFTMIVDHIKPIALGGEEFDMDNCQTLCWDCNKIKTKRDARKIALRRKYIKILKKGQKFL